MPASAAGLIRQHLIDPEICIRCNTCESTCPVGAISHDARNYVVDANICNLCMACVPPCPTGSIDNWRAMPRARAYSVEDQFGWDVLPAELSADDLALAGDAADVSVADAAPPVSSDAPGKAEFDASAYAAVVPPWSAERADCEFLWTEGGREVGFRHGRRQCAGDGRRQGLRHPSHRARFRLHDIPGAGGPVDRHRPSGRRRRRAAALPAPVFGREPAQRRAAGLQQYLAHREAGARGSSGPPRPRRRQQLSLRLESGRQGRGDRTVRPELPHAQPPAKRDRDDLHRHRQRADAGDDRVAAPIAQIRQVRGRQADAVLRRPHQGGIARISARS